MHDIAVTKLFGTAVCPVVLIRTTCPRFEKAKSNGRVWFSIRYIMIVIDAGAQARHRDVTQRSPRLVSFTRSYLIGPFRGMFL
jgi:hypothetical protein